MISTRVSQNLEKQVMEIDKKIGKLRHRKMEIIARLEEMAAKESTGTHIVEAAADDALCEHDAVCEKDSEFKESDSPCVYSDEERTTESKPKVQAFDSSGTTKPKYPYDDLLTHVYNSCIAIQQSGKSITVGSIANFMENYSLEYSFFRDLVERLPNNYPFTGTELLTDLKFQSYVQDVLRLKERFTRSTRQVPHATTGEAQAEAKD